MATHSELTHDLELGGGLRGLALPVLGLAAVAALLVGLDHLMDLEAPVGEDLPAHV